uniref:Uncharacterized protein n=1 Tax=Romanomermis culicivorax TaxID=13658 RepID=A0A915HN09_ROMCU
MMKTGVSGNSSEALEEDMLVGAVEELMTLEYVPNRQNVMADFLSRKDEPQETEDKNPPKWEHVFKIQFHNFGTQTNEIESQELDQCAANQVPGTSVLIDPENIAWLFGNKEKEIGEVKEGEDDLNDDDDKINYPIDLEVIAKLQKEDTNLTPIWERLGVKSTRKYHREFYEDYNIKHLVCVSEIEQWFASAMGYWPQRTMKP